MTYDEVLKMFKRDYAQIIRTGDQSEIRFAWEQLLDDLCPYNINSTQHQKYIHQCPTQQGCSF